MPKHRLELRGNNLTSFKDHHTAEYLICGAAGTGKTWSNLFKILQYGTQYAGARMLILRKTRKSLTETALVTWEDEILGHGHPIIGRPIQRGHRSMYVFPNGSTLVPAGMDDPAKVLSSSWDLIYINESTELSAEEWEIVGSRLGRSHSRDETTDRYDQLIADCNPTNPHHWLKRRSDAGLCKLYETWHWDNPHYYDVEKAEWTMAGRRYIGRRLGQLTGTRKERFLLGNWVAATGTVYEFINKYEPIGHLLPPDWQPQPGWKRVWAIDWGKTSPTVCFDDRTEILTPAGFVRFSELRKDSLVASINPQSRSVEWQKPTGYVDEVYHGPMVTVESPRAGADFCVTPNHLMVVENRKSGKWKKVRADQIPSGNAIPVGWNSAPESATSMLQIPGFKKKQLPPISLDKFARFLGLLIADGCVSSKRGIFRARIGQKNRIEQVRSVLKDTGWNWREGKPRADGLINFMLHERSVCELLISWGCEVRSPFKRIPKCAFSWDVTSLLALLDGLMLGDGMYRNRGNNNQVIASECFYTTSIGLADDVQAIACILGMPTSLKPQTRGRCINDSKMSTEYMYPVRFHTTRRAGTDGMKPIMIPYNGRVYCVSVPNGIIVVRRNGRPMICGNCQFWAVDEDGRMYLYREFYKTHLRPDRLAKWVLEELELGNEPLPEAIVCDHDEERKHDFEKSSNLSLSLADKTFRDKGIESVQARFDSQEDGRPAIFFKDKALGNDPDRELVDKGKPTCTLDELGSYVWSDKKEDEPIEYDDHGCFVAGTMISSDRGQTSIELVRIGDKVLTRIGYFPVTDAAMTDRDASVISVEFEDGRTLTGTPNHPIWVEGVGFVRLDEIGLHLKVNRVNLENIRQPVYNITVHIAHEYFANGILVSNCDAMRYAQRWVSDNLMPAGSEPRTRLDPFGRLGRNTFK